MNTTPTPETTEPENFESAFLRLEAILEQMNTSNISLDESLKLFEEADKLITLCNTRLNTAERKIELLIKARNGELAVGADLKPTTQKMA